MKTIAKALNIEKNITSYTARHTFATIMKNLGASTELISELFRHNSVSVTENYLDTFDSEIIKRFAAKLASSIKP